MSAVGNDLDSEGNEENRGFLATRLRSKVRRGTQMKTDGRGSVRKMGAETWKRKGKESWPSAFAEASARQAKEARKITKRLTGSGSEKLRELRAVEPIPLDRFPVRRFPALDETGSAA